VEKILGKGEHLPTDWPISGTTGYEFIASLSDVLVDDENIDALRTAYQQVVGKPVDMPAELRAAKLMMTDKNFAGEFSTLLQLALTVARTAKSEGAALDENTLRSALRELLVAIPVYRTYGTEEGLPPASLELLQKVAEKLRTGAHAPDPQALDLLIHILTGEVAQPAVGAAATFRIRFQQLTGPLMAKSVEDTLFFRQNMDLALNEVGAEPMPRAFSLERFHAQMKTRLERQPDALSGTSTHDTKRGEDARARLYTLTEAPELWAENVTRWRRLNQSQVSVLDDGPAPKPAGTWMLYQALAGVWPVGLHPQDPEGLERLEARFLDFVEKALREAKLRTSWDDNNDPYEKAVLDYARHLLSPTNQAFVQDFSAALQPFIRAGLVNGLTQTVIKLTAPGVPDIYQGSEALNFSLVDPDNRREPDFDALARLLTEDETSASPTQESWLSGQLKQHVIARLLHLRRRQPTLFRRGDYLPLAATGQQAENVIAYARAQNDAALIVIAPRLMFGALRDSHDLTHTLCWARTDITLPQRLASRRYRNVLTGEAIGLTDRINLASVEGCSSVILMSE